MKTIIVLLITCLSLLAYAEEGKKIQRIAISRAGGFYTVFNPGDFQAVVNPSVYKITLVQKDTGNIALLFDFPRNKSTHLFTEADLKNAEALASAMNEFLQDSAKRGQILALHSSDENGLLLNVSANDLPEKLSGGSGMQDITLVLQKLERATDQLYQALSKTP